MEILLVFAYGKANRSGDDCIEDSLVLTIPKRREQAMPRRTTQSSTRAGPEGEGTRGKFGQGHILWFLEKQCVKQGKQA